MKREMFTKLRTSKYMKAQETSDEAVIEFTGRVQRMARIHHFGLKDRPKINIKEVQYSPRPLLGFKDESVESVRLFIIEALAK